jgi:FtsH-binding integral membrane protein
MIALGIIFVITDIFKNKKHNKSFYSITIGIILAIMFILEYFLISMQNTIFYALLFIMSIGVFLGFHFAFVSKDHPTQMEKILSWTGMGIFGISLLGLLGFISNDYTFALIMGIIVLIIVGIGFLARRSKLGDMPH